MNKNINIVAINDLIDINHSILIKVRFYSWKTKY